mmetsp:Transcript_31781/g.62458  ORF Transcript_31781/g.62458 Transcript_31781/m.62458 type:complete len:520 (-) Transcript_31781:101-1660(-)
MEKQRERLEPLLHELDPNGEHGPERLWAALRSLGLEPEDFWPVDNNAVRVTNRIPDPEMVEHVQRQRREVLENLRRSRLEELQHTLAGLRDDDVRRYSGIRGGRGVNPVRPGDLPRMNGGAGTDFEAIQEQKRAKLLKEQQHKADQLVTGFLGEKKRLDHADAQIAAFEQRLAERRKEQEANLKAKRNDTAKKVERMQEQVIRARQQRREWEEECDEKIESKLAKASATRSQKLDRTFMRDNFLAAEIKREQAFMKAVGLEEERLSQIEKRQADAEERLKEYRKQREEELKQQAEASQRKFLQSQDSVHEKQEKWVTEKLAKHDKFKEHVQQVRKSRTAKLAERSKSTGDITRKNNDRWRQNMDRLKLESKATHAEILERHQAGEERAEHTIGLGLKCGIDVHTSRELREGTWGDLRQRRFEEVTRSRDAHMQALLLKIAEHEEKQKLRSKSQQELQFHRQRLAKDSLVLKDRAKEGFLKIQCEADERKIHGVMEGLGFKMPALPEEDDDQQQQQAQRV